MLAYHFLTQFRQASKKKVRSFTSETMSLLEGYGWPGNVRELENVVERAVALVGVEDETIGPDHLPEQIVGPKEAAITTAGESLNDALEQVKRRMVVKALDKYSGNKTKAAEHLGLSRLGLNKMIKKMGLEE